jgi:hypothetical protein
MGLSWNCGVQPVHRFIVLLCERKSVSFSKARIEDKNFSSQFSETREIGRVRTPSFYCSARRLARMSGNTANASSWVMFSTELRLDPYIAFPHQTVCWTLSRSFISGEGLIDRNLALRAWPSHVFDYSLFTSATSRQFNFGSPVFIWKHSCTVPCSSQALYIKIIALHTKC